MYTLENILSEFYAGNALELERVISQFHRAKGSYEYSRAVEFIKNHIGIGNVISYPANCTYETWKVPKGFNIVGGYLKITKPYVRYILEDAKLEPIKVVFLSGSSEGIMKLKVFDVGNGESESLFPEEASGNSVIANGNPSIVFRIAKKLGVKCVLLYFMRAQNVDAERTPEMLSQAVNYLSFPSYSAGEIVGFSLSYNEYKELVSLSKDGLEIEIELEINEGNNNLEVLEARIGDENFTNPILLTAHLCHPKPGANDNASGSALLAEIVRVLNKFHFERAITALWIPEMYGTVAYINNHKLDYCCGINLDMVGENQDITHSTLDVVSTPWSLPSFLSELVGSNLESIYFRVREGEYTGGSDHYVFDDLTVSIPFVSLTQWPDRFYHSSEDTVDKSSFRSFKWIGEGVLKAIYQLNYGIPEDIFKKVKSRIIAEYVKNSGKNKVVNDWISYRYYKSLEMLSGYGSAKQEMEYISNNCDFSQIPKRRKVKKFIGPLGEVWKSEQDESWEIALEKKVPQIRDYLFELLNFLEAGYEIGDAITLSSAEFGIKENLTEESQYFIKRLQEEGLLDL